MKKFFVFCFAMFLAAGMVTSCGNKDAAEEKKAEKGTKELAVELTDLLNKTNEALNKADGDEQIIAAIEKMVADEAAILKNYPKSATDDFMNKNEDEFVAAYPEEGPAYFKSHADFVDILYNIERSMDPSSNSEMWEKRHKTSVI